TLRVDRRLTGNVGAPIEHLRAYRRASSVGVGLRREALRPDEGHEAAGPEAFLVRRAVLTEGDAHQLLRLPSPDGDHEAPAGHQLGEEALWHPRRGRGDEDAVVRSEVRRAE